MTSVSVQPPVSRRPFGQNYALVVVAVIFLALLSSAGLRATPGVLMLPLQTAFGWNVGVISLSAAIGIFLYGLAGPFAAAVMQRFGIRRTVLGARSDVGIDGRQLFHDRAMAVVPDMGIALRS